MNEQPVILYGISKVHYDKTHTIDRVIVHHIEARTVQPGREFSRADAVRGVKKGDRVVSHTGLNRRPVRVGQKVRVLRKKFIRSIRNGTDSDNLAQLPRIVSSYGISKVRYNRAHIETVMVHKVECQKICCDGCEWNRLDVVHRLNEGDSFVTLPKLNGGKAAASQTVEVWHKEFIRSTPSGKDRDNLADLDRLNPKIPDVRIRPDGITICCDGCEWRTADVIHRIGKSGSFITLPKTDR